MPKYDVEIDGRILILRRTLAGRLTEALHRFATTLPLTGLAIGVLFGIEWIGQSPPADELPFYIGSTVLIAGLISVAFALTRLLRSDLWVIDLVDGLLAFETSMPWGQVRGAAISLDDVQEFRLIGEGRQRELLALVDDEEEIVASASADEIEPIVARIEDFSAQHGRTLTVVKSSGM